MRVTQWGEYGIHCAVFIARQMGAGKTSVPAAEIAAYQGIALDYAQQILQRLRRSKLVDSVRGPQGGYKLSRSPKDITIYELLFASEGDTFEVICEHKPLNTERCSPGALCNLRPLWFNLRDYLNEFLKRYTLEDLVEGRLEQEQPPVVIGANRQANANAV